MRGGGVEHRPLVALACGEGFKAPRKGARGTGEGSVKMEHPRDLGSPDAHLGACLSGFASSQAIPHSQMGLPLGEEKLKLFLPLKAEVRATENPPSARARAPHRGSRVAQANRRLPDAPRCCGGKQGVAAHGLCPTPGLGPGSSTRSVTSSTGD